ncbi:uncharacterized protein LOC133248796 [Bos javanicus]|uniref:uncharacterized protein LOC133248796 n=1 Tax=Bos javanicus TaxID=9906 RepID=UPI002AA6B27B|nr:uncharacterized protein LOC133248796 [Bos javanicus]
MALSSGHQLAQTCLDDGITEARKDPRKQEKLDAEKFIQSEAECREDDLKSKTGFMRWPLAHELQNQETIPPVPRLCPAEPASGHGGCDQKPAHATNTTTSAIVPAATVPKGSSHFTTQSLAMYEHSHPCGHQRARCHCSWSTTIQGSPPARRPPMLPSASPCAVGVASSPRPSASPPPPAPPLLLSLCCLSGIVTCRGRFEGHPSLGWALRWCPLPIFAAGALESSSGEGARGASSPAARLFVLSSKPCSRQALPAKEPPDSGSLLAESCGGQESTELFSSGPEPRLTQPQGLHPPLRSGAQKRIQVPDPWAFRAYREPEFMLLRENPEDVRASTSSCEPEGAPCVVKKTSFLSLSISTDSPAPGLLLPPPHCLYLLPVSPDALGLTTSKPVAADPIR